MAPLDTGTAVDTHRSSWDGMETLSLRDAATLGDGLRAARERSGRSLAQLADATRVRRDYLLALEQNAFDKLPSRPFAIGYVKAYARALGLDEEGAADRFKSESPDGAAALQAPIGSDLDPVKPRVPLWAIGGVVLVGAVVLWNIAQRAMNTHEATPVTVAPAPQNWPQGVPASGVVQVSVPQPAPADQTVPQPYVTPGMEEQLAIANGDMTAEEAAARAEELKAAAQPVRPAFNAKGVTYGAEPNQSAVTLQARKAAYLVVRDGQNTVYFARQLAKGEAYRAPLAANGLSVEVSDPAAFDLYMNGEYRGVLQAPLNNLSKMNGEAMKQAQQLNAARVLPTAG